MTLNQRVPGSSPGAPPSKIKHLTNIFEVEIFTAAERHNAEALNPSLHVALVGLQSGRQHGEAVSASQGARPATFQLLRIGRCRSEWMGRGTAARRGRTFFGSPAFFLLPRSSKLFSPSRTPLHRIPRCSSGGSPASGTVTARGTPQERRSGRSEHRQDFRLR
jgi:hypothetical protein